MQRGVNRRTGTENNRGFAHLCTLPRLQTFGIGQSRMQQRNMTVKTRLETADGLRGESNFRHQHQHLFALFQYLMHDLQIDFGLAAAR